jgi:hypothetical protein
VDRRRRTVRAQAREGPTSGTDRVEHALSSVRFLRTPAWDERRSLGLWRLSWVRRETPQADQRFPTGPAAPCWRAGGTRLLPVPGCSALRHRGVAGAGREERADLGKHCATARTQEAVGADCDEPPWQSMRKEAVEEGVGGERQPCPPSAGALCEAARDGPIVERFQAVVAQGNPGDGGGEGGKDLRAGTGRLAVGHPVLVPDLGWHGLAEASGGQRRFALPTEALRERTDRDEPSCRARREPLRARW